MQILPVSPPIARKKMLIVDDDESIRLLFSIRLEQIGYEVFTASDPGQAIEILRLNSIDAIILDLFFDDCNGLDVMDEILQISPGTIIFVITGSASIDLAVNATKKGANDFLLKSDPLEENLSKINEAFLQNLPPSPSENIQLKSLGIVGKSPHLTAIADTICRIKSVDSTVLVTGESGTGKELIARAIHKMSTRANGPFIAINCAAISESILESELFGYKKGAFTDAKIDRKGYFETCSSGTLLLDEIGEMPLELQAKILRVLQEKEVTPLGSCRPVPIRTRIIAATNRDLKVEIEKKRFREDLYYRLAVFKINVPPLRTRREDIPILIDHFAYKISKKLNKALAKIPKSVYAYLTAYDWPGNIRELQNAMERAVVLSTNTELRLSDLLPGESLSDQSVLEICYDNQDLPLNFSDAKKFFEQSYLSHLLRKSDGNVAEAARLSGQYRPNLYRLMNKHGINPQSYKS